MRRVRTHNRTSRRIPMRAGRPLKALNRRAFLSGAASLLAIPAVLGQRASRPIVGYFHSASSDQTVSNLAAFRDALARVGFREEENLSILYRWAEGRYDRFPAIVAEFVQRRVDVIVAMGAVEGPRAAKRAAGTIPVVFGIGSDPVAMGLVDNLNPRSGTVTGATFFSTPLGPKRLEMLRELMPGLKSVALLMNPLNINAAKVELDGMTGAAQAFGLKLLSVTAKHESEFDDAFAEVVREKVGGVVVGTDTLFNNRIDQLVSAAARHAIPTMYFLREFVAAGGLISYGASIVAMYGQVGDRVGQILKGERPADLPIIQPTKFELSINRATAQVLDIEVPRSLRALADEVIG